MHLRVARIVRADARGIEHGDQIVFGPANRHAETGEPDVMRIEVIVAVHGDGFALGQACPHPVGATAALAPVRPGHESGISE